ncbi:MAG TPA: preprotein translocase subunit SecA, partial [Candidatus Paceibacterota bacterium]|nr:preprotein translocase subunit SecA [Candidatus Paceibacterota bacterium]
MLSSIKSIFGDENSSFLKRADGIVQAVNALEAEVSALPTESLPGKTAELKARIAAGETLDSVLPYAFALVREAAKRTLGQRHFDVQLVGGYALHSGHVAEMKTGEGKTQ